jgi:3D (Asp-Asp-Asp) domain-containing protein
MTLLVFFLCSSGFAFNEPSVNYSDSSDSRSKTQPNRMLNTLHGSDLIQFPYGITESALEGYRYLKSLKRFHSFRRHGFGPFSRGAIPDSNISDSADGPKTRVLEVTAYNVGDAAQNYGDPCQSANGENICAALDSGLKRCAANFVPFGTKLYIAGYGVCTVTDRMHRRYRHRVDIAMKKNEKSKALRFGVKRLKIRILGRRDG